MQLKPSLTPISLVGIAWALASRNNENEIKCAEWTQAYLNDLIQNSTDEKHKRFFNAVIPLLQGVVAKISLTRTNALKENNFLNKMEKTRIEEIDSIANIGMNFRNSISKGIGILGSMIGASGFAALSIINNNGLAIFPITILGLFIGFAVEYLIQHFSWKNKKKILQDIYDNKKNKWDENFILVTSNTMLRFYRQTVDIVKDIFEIEYENRTRDLARDFWIMTELFLQKPLQEGQASELPSFIQACSGIEYEMARFINTTFSSDEFRLFRKKEKSIREKENKRKEETLPEDPYRSGFEGLSGFLANKNIIDEELLDDIMSLREKRVRIIHYADYDELTWWVKKVKATKQDLIKVLDEKEKVMNTFKKDYVSFSEKILFIKILWSEYGIHDIVCITDKCIIYQNCEIQPTEIVIHSEGLREKKKYADKKSFLEESKRLLERTGDKDAIEFFKEMYTIPKDVLPEHRHDDTHPYNISKRYGQNLDESRNKGYVNIDQYSPQK